jgi:hypothetical protein
MKTILFLLAIVYAISSKAQDTTEFIPWSEKKLVWADFKEDNTVEKYRKKMAAKISSRVWVLPARNIINDQLAVKITAICIPKYSWVRQSAVGNLTVLAHEQDHFEITELFARKFRKALTGAAYSRKAYTKKISKLTKQFRKELSSMQYQYDEETWHGTKTDLQRWWHYYIINQLEEFAAYKVNTVLVNISN